jgi:hypothetical protein
MFLYLSDNLSIKIDCLEDCEKLTHSIVEYLDKMNVSTKINGSKVYFKNIRKNSTDLGENKKDAIKLIREG